MFAHEYVITLDEMPDLRTYVRKDQVVTGIFEKIEKKLSFKAYPTLVQDNLIIKAEKRIKSIEVYNAMGACIKREKATGKEAIVSFEGINAGIYLVVVNNAETVKVWKE